MKGLDVRRSQTYSLGTDMNIRLLSPQELTGVYSIDMREDGATVFEAGEDGLHVRHEIWSRPPRSHERWAVMIAGWREMLENGGAAWGGFHDERMVGIIVLRLHLTPDTAQLAALFVSRPFRRTGIATHLTKQLLATAKAAGAKYVYVSATPSESAVGFYRSLGFEQVTTVNPELFALEPEDIHLILALESVQGG